MEEIFRKTVNFRLKIKGVIEGVKQYSQQKTERFRVISIKLVTRIVFLES